VKNNNNVWIKNNWYENYKERCVPKKKKLEKRVLKPDQFEFEFTTSALRKSPV